MRRILGLAGVLVVCGMAAGCNQQPLQAPQQQACNCHGTVTTQNPGAETQRFEAPPEPAHRRYAYTPRHRYGTSAHRRGWHHGARDYDDGSYSRETHDTGSHDTDSHDYDDRGVRDHDYRASTASVSAYSYRSTSRVYRTSSESYGSGYSNGGSYSDDDGFVDAGSHHETDGGWRDGYGRYHNRAQLTRREFNARMDPWRGYGVDCPDGR